MNPSPEHFLTAASFDWDTLVPILFFVLYGIAQLFGAKNKKRKRAEAAEAAEEEEPEEDPVERARQIREEIRRKIEERRQMAEGGNPRPVDQPRRVAYDPTVPESQQRKPLAVPAPRPVPRPIAPIPQARSEPTMIQRLEHQRQRLEDARKLQREAHQKAMRIESEAGAFHHKKLGAKATREVSAFKHKELGIGKKNPARTGEDSFQGQVLAGLRGPNALRKAVLYREILGPPVGLR
ncbi:MAG TPA: hypothetical protein VK995_03370 [Oceanipulchritudo sp.]|nr:hypothetical protein [Oceanipulchritudo sp.]